MCVCQGKIYIVDLVVEIAPTLWVSFSVVYALVRVWNVCHEAKWN